MNSSENRTSVIPTASPITRRDFMKKTALTAGAITLLGQGIGFAENDSGFKKVIKEEVYSVTVRGPGHTGTPPSNEQQIRSDPNFNTDRMNAENQWPENTNPQNGGTKVDEDWIWVSQSASIISTSITTNPSIDDVLPEVKVSTGESPTWSFLWRFNSVITYTWQ